MSPKSLLLVGSLYAVASANSLDPSAFRLAFNTPPLAYNGSAEEVVPAAPNPDLGRAISAGRALGGVGTAMWSCGKVLEVVGIVMLVNKNEAGVGLLIPGMALDLLGPIPSCIGEKVVKNAAGQQGAKGLSSPSGMQAGMSGGQAYAFSWAFLGLGVLGNLIPTIPGKIIGMISAGTGEVLRGVAAIGPLVRVNRYARRVNVTPSYSPNGEARVVLTYAM